MLRFLAVFVGVACLAGCAGAPVQEMSDARQAIAAARAAGATPASSPDFYAAEAAIARAEAHLEAQEFKQARLAAMLAKRHAAAALAIRRFLILGKVQGVYFRHSARLEAKRLTVRGIARNLPDGSVEVIAHGEAAAVETLRAWLRRGPPQARVDEVRELTPDRAQPIPQDFETY
jgi:acylphosphatase